FQRDQFSFQVFYGKRVRRILPNLIFLLLIVFGFGWYELFTDYFRVLGKHIASGAGFISNFTLWSEAGYFDRAAETKPLLHLWSLAVEEQFYILWPLLLFCAARLGGRFLPILFISAMLSFFVNVYQVNANPTQDFYLLPSRIWELAAGGWLGC